MGGGAFSDDWTWNSLTWNDYYNGVFEIYAHNVGKYGAVKADRTLRLTYMLDRLDLV
jgi:hypothetical protein